MEIARVVALAAFVSAFFSLFFLGASIVHCGSRTMRERRLAKASGARGPKGDWLARNGVRAVRFPARLALKTRPVAEWNARLCEALEYRGYTAVPEAVCSVLVASVLVLAVAGGLVSGSWEFGVLGGVCLAMGAGFWAKRTVDARAQEVREALPDALHSMETCFRVGHSLPQTLEELSGSVQGPLGEAFRAAWAVLQSGGTTSDALHALRDAENDPELAFVAASLEVQHRTGSSMVEVLESTRQSVADELELKRSLKTQTAQAKLSAQIVTVMPFLLMAFLSAVSSGFLEPFFTSVVGVGMLCVALAMQAAGIAMVRRMLRFEVD